MARKKLTPEEKAIKETEDSLARIENNLNNSYKELVERLKYIGEPTYTFQVGDKVSIGRLEDVVIDEVKNNGKIYKIDFTSVNHNYGNPIRTEHQKMYVPWHDLRKITDNNTSVIKNKDIRLSYSQTHLTALMSKTYHFGVDFDPEYQRDYVWEESDKVSLIDSIFNNIDIGKFVFVHNEYEVDTPGYSVLDGKQRVRAILDFYEDRFQYKGMYFSDLCPRDQYFFEDYTINIAEVRNVTQEQILRHFVMLNRTGKIMDKAHLEKVEQMLNELEA